MLREIKEGINRKWTDFVGWFENLTPLEQDIFLTAVGAVATIVLAYAIRKSRA